MCGVWQAGDKRGVAGAFWGCLAQGPCSGVGRTPTLLGLPFFMTVCSQAPSVASPAGPKSLTHQCQIQKAGQGVLASPRRAPLQSPQARVPGGAPQGVLAQMRPQHAVWLVFGFCHIFGCSTCAMWPACVPCAFPLKVCAWVWASWPVGQAAFKGHPRGVLPPRNFWTQDPLAE